MNKTDTLLSAFTDFLPSRSFWRKLALGAALLFSEFAAPKAWAQFTHLTVEQGLVHSNITCVVQDKRGFMWLGSGDGLTRYDGYQFKAYKHAPGNPNSLLHNEITALFHDRAGKLWIGTAGGLDYFDPVTESFTHFTHQPDVPTSLGAPKVTCIREDRSGNVWVGTLGGGLHQVIRNGNQGVPVGFRRYTDFSSHPGTRNPVWVSAIAQDQEGTLWIGTVGEGLFTFDPAGGRATSHRCNAPGYTGETDVNVYALCVDAAGTLWVGTDKLGFYTVDTGRRQWRVYGSPRTPLEDDALQIVEDAPGKLWVGTWQGGLYYLDTRTGQWTRYATGDARGSITSNKINTVYRDRTGTLWVGTWGGGLNIKHPAKPAIAHYFRESKQTDSKSLISDLCEDVNGNLWLAVVGGGLARYDLATETYVTYRHDPRDPNSLADEYMTSLLPARSGHLWIGSHKGVNVFDPNTGRFTLLKHNPDNPNSLASNSVIAMLEDRDGRFWLANTAHGLDRLDPRTNTFTHYRHDPRNPNSLAADKLITLYQGRDGTLWIGTGQGLDALNPATGAFRHYKHQPGNPESLSDNTVSSIAEDHAGNLWVGTFSQGLNKLDRQKGTFTRYRVEEGLPNNAIFSIIEDQHRKLWVSTNKGVSQFNPLTGKFRNFDVRDGLQANEYYLNAAFQNRQGQIFLGGINGFNVFHPDGITENTAIPPVVLTDFKVFNKSVPVGKAEGDELSLPTIITECRQVTLPHSSSVFSLEFAALNYLHPEKNQYQYKLEGLETDWVLSGDRRFVSYTTLDPGTYTFRVRGSNNDGVWNEAGATLRIIITPPWWRTWWAYALDVLIAAALLYLAFRYFLYQERLKNALDLERLESEKLHEIDSLKTRFFANISHEFRTPLTLILGPVEARLAAVAALPDDHPDKRDLKLMHRSARRLLTLINQLLDLSKLEAGSLKLEPTEGNLLGFLKALVYSFSSLAESRHIILTFHSERTALPARFDRDKLEKVVTNLLANALKFTPEGGSVAVTVSTLATGGTAVTRTGLAPASQQQFVVITVADTGIGIPADRLGRVFDRFYQVDGSNTREHSGTGIGLALTQELVHLHGGTIHVQSEEGKGTQFTVRLPLHEVQGAGDAVLAPDDLSPEPVPQPSGASVGPKTPGVPAIPLDMNAPLLLIVEDNEEVRHYIHDVFAGEYRILEAQNGEEGLKKALEMVPNLVITDLMMPRMDGMELCRRLKTDERTSHIPVVLLTARASAESRVGGLETGADDYITKPFHVHELQLKVRNLVAGRQLLRERFAREVKLQPKDIAITSADEKFLRVAIETVEKHMADSDFSVEALESEMSMSKMQLYRKLKALTDQSPSEFIRTIRLKRAAALLGAKSGTITEIAYEVGFNNLSYFAKCFKEMYGVTPSEYTDQSPAPVK